ncbi:hypothetical protein [Lentilactobacillus hilgardii]|uniref:hypothetical protein n=1 Tax=Lentilactobacillus hilgardii TaxID=1588 RepID=UPI003FA60B1C
MNKKRFLKWAVFIISIMFIAVSVDCVAQVTVSADYDTATGGHIDGDTSGDNNKGTGTQRPGTGATAGTGATTSGATATAAATATNLGTGTTATNPGQTINDNSQKRTASSVSDQQTTSDTNASNSTVSENANDKSVVNGSSTTQPNSEQNTDENSFRKEPSVKSNTGNERSLSKSSYNEYELQYKHKPYKSKNVRKGHSRKWYKKNGWKIGKWKYWNTTNVNQGRRNRWTAMAVEGALYAIIPWASIPGGAVTNAITTVATGIATEHITDWYIHEKSYLIYGKAPATGQRVLIGEKDYVTINKHKHSGKLKAYTQIIYR